MNIGTTLSALVRDLATAWGWLKAAITISILMGAAAFNPAAAISGVTKVDTQKDEFIMRDEAKIIAEQRVRGGIAFQSVGQRVIAPQLTYRLEYKSRGNRYVMRDGATIEAKQDVTAGYADQAVGQEVTR